MQIDILIPAHPKDLDTLDLCIKYAKQNVQNLHKIYIVSKTKLTNNAEWIPESDYPFTYKDVTDMIGNHWRTGWYYAGLFQTTSVIYIDYLLNNVLILDCDTFFLKPINFVNEQGMGLFNVSPSDGTPPYLEHMERLVSNLTKQHKLSGVAHHILMNREILKSLFEIVEKKFQMPFWKADLHVTLSPYKSIPNEGKYKHKHRDGPGRFTSYELYFNYALKYFPNKCKVRPLNSIMCYKGKIPAQNMTLSAPSRTNLNGKVQIISKNEEAKMPQFNKISDALSYLSKICEQKGYESVTFQNHTRIGHTEHIKINNIFINNYK